MQLLVLACFFLSGISGLMLEIVWTRMLEHVFGATTLAVSTVLTCFMGGLALGSWLFGRFADKARAPLVAYALAEGAVGASALCIPAVIEGFYPGLNRWMVASLGNDFLAFSLVRFAAVAVILIVPATCMGATLPLLSRHFLSTQDEMPRVGSRVGALYTVNTLGAVSGVFLATFFLLPGIGLAATNRVAGALNLALALAILAARKRLVRAAPDNAEAPLSADESEAPPFGAGPFARRAAMAAFFLSGLAAMSLQVVWNRVMAMVIGSSVYSFSLVLIAFLVGLAGGAACFSRTSRRIADPVLALALVELGVAAAAMLAHLYMDHLPRAFAVLVTTYITAYDRHVELVQLLMFLITALAVLPATFCMGATFPLTIRILSSDLKRVGRDVGGVYALNTLGAICGSFLSAFVFVPLLSRHFGGIGMQLTFFVSVAVYAAAGLALLLASRARPLVRALVGLPAAACAALFFAAAPAWNLTAMTIGVFRISLMEDALDEVGWGNPDVTYYHDGVSTTVSVELWGRHVALKNNGKVEASNGDDMPTQIMVAAYPLLFHRRGPAGLDVAVVGFGSGVSVGAALEFPVRKVDAVELENAVVEASRAFGATEGDETDPELNVNHLTYRRPDDPALDPGDPDTYVQDDRLAIINNDGRNFLASATSRYDVIISEPSNPWITGVANLFTADHFRAAVRALRPDGIFCQWVQLYELSPENIKTIFRTFASVFPYTALFSSKVLSSDTILLGSFEPIAFDLGRVARAMAGSRVRAELARAFVSSPADVFARALLVDRAELLAYTDGEDRGAAARAPINTDDNALIEFGAPRDLISSNRFQGYLSSIYTNEWRFARLGRALEGLGHGEEQAVGLARLALALFGNGRKQEARALVERAAAMAPGNAEVAAASRAARLLGGEEGAPMPAFEDPAPGSALLADERDELAAGFAGVAKALERGASKEALERFARIPARLRQRGGPVLLLLEGYLHVLNANPEDSTECEKAIAVLGELVRDHPPYVDRHPEAHYFLSLCHENALAFDKAVAAMRLYVDLATAAEDRARIVLAQAKADIDGMMAGLGGTMPIPLPPDAPDLPTTDAPGESRKDFQDDRGFGHGSLDTSPQPRIKRPSPVRE